MEEKTKKCKHCKSEIPADAKVCPQCRKKQGGGKLKWVAIIIVILAVIGAVAGGGGKSDEPKKVDNSSAPDSAPAETPEESVSKQTVFSQGETAEMNDVQVTLVGYEESAGSEYNTPSEGNVFVLANFEIANNSDSELAVSSMVSFEAYADDYALNYSLSALMEKSDSNQLDGTVAPGKKMNGWIGYEVPANWSNIEIHFTDNVWRDSKFVFEIKK